MIKKQNKKKKKTKKPKNKRGNLILAKTVLKGDTLYVIENTVDNLVSAMLFVTGLELILNCLPCSRSFRTAGSCFPNQIS